MKKTKNLLLGLVLPALAFAGFRSGATVITKADNTNSLGSAASWAGGVAPGPGDIANWSGTYSASPDGLSGLTNSLRTVNSGTGIAWQGITVGSVSGTGLTTNTIYWGTGTPAYGAQTNLASASESGTVVTFTTKANHGYAPGQQVTIAGVTPSGYNGTFTVLRVPNATTFAVSNPVTGLSAATTLGTVESAIYIGGAGTSVANSSYTIGASGIDLSAASHSVALCATGFAFNGSQTWNVPAGRNLRLAASGVGSASAKVVTSGNDGLIDIVGAGVVDANQGGGTTMADAGGYTAFTGKWRVNSGATLRGLRNGATAWGSNPGADSITLNGGTLAVGGISGAVGNWTWTNAITLAAATTSYIEDQNVAGSGRYLKLNSPISGSGNVVFRNAGGTNSFTDPNSGFILTGPNTMSGTVTIAGPVENGVAGRLTYVRVGGIGADSVATGVGADGSLGTASIVDNGLLTMALNTAITLQPISGTGSLRLGYTPGGGGEFQNVTLTGANTYNGDTTINMGTLTLAAGASLPNTANIFLTPFTSASGVASTLDVSATTGLTLQGGQRLVGGPNNATANNSCIVMGNVTAGTGTAIVPGGTNAINTLTIAGDLSLAGGATLAFDVSNSANDLLAVQNLSVSGTTTVLVTPPAGGLYAGSYTLISVAGNLGGTAANFSLAGLSSTGRGQTFSLVYDTAPGASALKLVVVGSPAALVWKGNASNNVWDTGTTTNWLNAGLPDAFFAGDTVTFDDTGVSTPAVTLSGPIQANAITISAAQNYTFAGTGRFTGTGGLTNSGTGTVSLLTSNDFTGNVVVNGGGILAITNETVLNKPTSSTDRGLTLDNASALVVTNTVTLGANTNRGVLIGSGGGTLVVSNGATLAITNTIGDTDGLGVVTKLGNGTLVLSGVNNNYGNGSSGSLIGTIVKGGTVIYGSGAGLSRAGNTSGTSGFFAVPFELDSGVVDINGMVSYQPNFAGGSAATGTGVILYNGTVNVNGLAGAPLVIQDSGATPTGWGSAAANVLNYSGVNNPGTLTISARFAAVGTSTASTRTFIVDDSPATSTEVNITAPMGVTSVNSTNQDGRNVTLIKDGAGTLQISSSNNFPIVQVNGGTLKLNHAQALGTDRTISIGVSGGTGSQNSVIVSGGILDLNGFSPIIGGLNDAGNSSGTVRNNAGSLSTLTLGISSTNTVIAGYSGLIEDGPGKVALVKAGPGAQALVGLNTYTGGTTVSNGTLYVNGSIANGATVRAGGTLAGLGTIHGAVSVDAGGTLATGDTNMGALTLTSTPILDGRVLLRVDRNAGAPVSDKLMVTGNPIVYAGTLVVTNTGAPLVVGDTFSVFGATGYSGAFALVSQTPGQSVAWDTSRLAIDGTLSVRSILPSEPPVLASGLVGGQYELSWPADYTGYQLQVQTNQLNAGLSTNWAVWPGSTATNRVFVPIVTENPSVFLRLVSPQ